MACPPVRGAEEARRGLRGDTARLLRGSAVLNAAVSSPPGPVLCTLPPVCPTVRAFSCFPGFLEAAVTQDVEKWGLLQASPGRQERTTGRKEQRAEEARIRSALLTAPTALSKPSLSRVSLPICKTSSWRPVASQSLCKSTSSRLTGRNHSPALSRPRSPESRPAETREHQTRGHLKRQPLN